MILVEWYCTHFEIDLYGVQVCTDWLVVCWMIGWELTRTIVEKPLLHDIICVLFLVGYLSYILGSIYLIYKLIRGSTSRQVEWSFEGLPWSYWKTMKWLFVSWSVILCLMRLIEWSYVTKSTPNQVGTLKLSQAHRNCGRIGHSPIILVLIHRPGIL